MSPFEGDSRDAEGGAAGGLLFLDELGNSPFSPRHNFVDTDYFNVPEEFFHVLKEFLTRGKGFPLARKTFQRPEKVFHRPKILFCFSKEFSAGPKNILSA